ncbi:TadE family protein [Candidatus Poriferisocius sp.]|uniref:TadE family protein n=1 Tax=Candidatus Poriferisocius sp. TaxID=3101276 RepID=UPI003B02CA29
MQNERGEITTTILTVPIAIFLITMIIQAALIFHAQAIVDAATQDGAQVGQSETGTKAAARSVVESVIGTSGGSLLSDVDITIETNPTQLSVTVQATVKSLIPGYIPKISSTSSGPREIFIAENQR